MAEHEDAVVAIINILNSFFPDDPDEDDDGFNEDRGMNAIIPYVNELNNNGELRIALENHSDFTSELAQKLIIICGKKAYFKLSPNSPIIKMLHRIINK